MKLSEKKKIIKKFEVEREFFDIDDEIRELILI